MATKGKGSFEYVFKDYDSIRSELIDLIPLMTSKWTDRNESDPGMVLLELFCGVGDMLAYYLDIMANQAFLPTATQREAVINICKAIDYYLTDASAATGNLLFTRAPYVTTGSPTTLASTITAGVTSVFSLDPPYGDYGSDDMIYLNNGVDGEFCRIRVMDVDEVTIYGVTQYSYGIGDVVGRIDKSYSVQISDVRVKAGSEPFETDPLGVYVIDGGNVYVDEARILSVNAGLKQITLTNAARYGEGDSIFIQDATIAAQNQPFVVMQKADRVLTLKETIPVWVNAGDTVARLIPCAHGQTRQETLGTSDGTANQKINLSYTPVVVDTIVVSINEGVGYEDWTRVSNFLSSDSNDKHFMTFTMADDIVQIIFGDNLNGKIPSFGAIIEAEYRQGGGSVGNVGAGAVTVIETPILDNGARAVSLIVINPDETSNGSDKETIESAKVNAPASLRALNRCVTEADYAAKSMDFVDPDWGQVALASAVEVAFDNAVVVHVWSEGSNGMAISSSAELKAALAVYLKSLAVATMSVSVVDGETIPIDITGTVYIKDNAINVDATNKIFQTIDLLFNVNVLTVGDDFWLGNLYEAIENLPEVGRADFTLPLRPGVVIPPNTVPIRGTVNVTVVGGY